MSPTTVCFLFDNGSLRAEATLSLRAVAKSLGNYLRNEVRAVSLLHSSGVDPRSLEGEPAELLEPALKVALGHGARSIVLLPLFFGPSAGITRYLPERLQSILTVYPDARIRVAQPLVNPASLDDRRIAIALAQRVDACLRLNALSEATQVVLVDHGSPQPGVTAVRDALGVQLAQLLANRVAGVHVASMERRAGSEYAFSDPLLADRLQRSPCDRGNVVLSLQFFSAGRHAGPGGDIAQIGRTAMTNAAGLRVYMTEPLGDEPRLIEVLADRYHEALKESPLAQA